MQPITTLSIVAYDPDRSEWGVAVASKFLNRRAPPATAKPDRVAVQKAGPPGK